MTLSIKVFTFFMFNFKGQIHFNIFKTNPCLYGVMLKLLQIFYLSVSVFNLSKYSSHSCIEKQVSN